jgi:hypothetical protein
MASYAQQFVLILFGFQSTYITSLSNKQAHKLINQLFYISKHHCHDDIFGLSLDIKQASDRYSNEEIAALVESGVPNELR